MGQIEGGTAQGVGLALMEEIAPDNSLTRNTTDLPLPASLPPLA